jgi:N12 class adenine-specific DNA methylase
MTTQLENNYLASGQQDIFGSIIQSKLSSSMVSESVKQPTTLQAVDYFLNDTPIYSTTPVQRFNASLKSIQTLKALIESNRYANPQEQKVLANYTGFGSLPQVFDEENLNFADKRKQLKALISEEEWDSIRKSTLSAFFTPHFIIEALSDSIAKSGFKHGYVTDPAAGTGTLIQALPKKSFDNSIVSMIELDKITSDINYALYPSAKLYSATGFEHADIENESQDLIISNPPFGANKVSDPLRSHLNGLTVHHYFMQRSIECVKEGGLYYAIVSTSFLDSKDTSKRLAMANQAELLNTVRLPKNVFEKYTGANATVDLMLFRKDINAPKNPIWIDLTSGTCPKTGECIQYNNFYDVNRSHMLGEMQITGHFQGNNLHCVIELSQKELEVECATLIKTFPSNVFRALKTKAVTQKATLKALAIESDLSFAQVNSLVTHADKTVSQISKITKNSKGENEYEYKAVSHNSEMAQQRILGMNAIRDILSKLLLAERSDHPVNEIESLRLTLNKRYDSYVKILGFVSQGANHRVYKNDPHYPNLMALEVDFQESISKPVAIKKQIKPRMASANKAPIFTERVISPYFAPTKADNALDALLICLNEYGTINIKRIASLINKSAKETITALKGEIFLDPISGLYEPKNIYLSGDVKTKLAQAEKAAISQPQFQHNVSELMTIQPKFIEAADIAIQCTSGWLPCDIVEAFIMHLLGDKSNPKVTYAMGEWHVKVRGFVPQPTAHVKYGTKDLGAQQLIENMYTGKELVIKKVDSQGNKYIDHDQTILAQSIGGEIKTAFLQWVFTDVKRITRIETLFNDKFNRSIATNYDADFMTLPGLTHTITPYKHQLRCIRRGVVTGKVLADIPIGGGKSLILISVIQEWLRLGLKSRILCSIPNHLVVSFSCEYLRLYPDAKIITLTPDDMSAQKRRMSLHRIKTGAAQVIIVPETTFKQIPISLDYEREFIKEDVQELTHAIEMVKKDRMSVKKLETLKDNLEFKLETLNNGNNKDRNLDMEELGIDAIVSDESHMLKNLFYTSKLIRNCAGMNSPSGSQRSYDFYLKTRYLNAKYEKAGIVLATGTPVSNSILEIYTYMRYMMLDELKAMDLQYLDSWVGLFAEATDEFELSPAGKGFKLRTRLRKFNNLPELLSQYSTFAEVVTEDELDDLIPALPSGHTKRPKMRGGEPFTHYLEPDATQEQFMQWLVYRSKNLNVPEVENDNLLSIMYSARAASLDLRMLDPTAPVNPKRKAVKCANEVANLYYEYSTQKGTQLIFCDLSVPNKARKALKSRIEKLEIKVKLGGCDAIAALKKLDDIGLDQRLALSGETFDVYSDIKQLLIAKGINEDEIAFSQDYQTPAAKKELYGKLNRGEIRVCIASTATMGTGANVNRKMVSVHNLDPTYRPSDMSQRNGRALRVGNEIYEADPENFKGIYVAYYATIRSLDAFLFQLLSSKAKFINSFRTSGMINNVKRNVSDIGEQTMTFEQIKAQTSDSKIVMEHFQTKHAVDILDIRFNQHLKNQIENNRVLERSKTRKDKLTALIGLCKLDQMTINKNQLPKDTFLMGTEKGAIHEYKNAVIYIDDLIRSNAPQALQLERFTDTLALPVIEYKGMKVEIELNKFDIDISLVGKLTYSFKRNYENVSARGIITVLNNYTNDFDKTFVQEYQDQLDFTQDNIDAAKREQMGDYPDLDVIQGLTIHLNSLTAQLAKEDDKNNLESIIPPIKVKNMTQRCRDRIALSVCA